MKINPQKIVNDKGHVTGFFINKNDFNLPYASIFMPIQSLQKLGIFSP